MIAAFHISTLIVVGGIVGSAVVPLLAQEPPRPLVVAADRINAVTPQAVPQQTIRIGSYDAGTRQFAWALQESYPPGLPDYKKDGTALPMHVAQINSRNVKYEFAITNQPENFQLSLSYLGIRGDTVTKAATFAGGIATVDLTPPPFSVQWVRINQAGAPVLRIWPRLRDQLGAFVVPYLLVSIVYEPPGAKSKATYSTTTTAGTSVSWGFSRSSGFVTEPAKTDTLMWVFNEVVGAYLKYAWGGVGEFLQGVLGDIGGVRTNEVQFIVDTTIGSSTTRGHSVAITEAVSTRNDDDRVYPGNGDVFVVLQDVIFVYVARQGRIYLTPVAFWHSRGIRGSDLAATLPAGLAQSYRSLDPNFGIRAKGAVATPGSGPRPVDPVLAGGGAGIGPGGGGGGGGPRFRQLPSQVCERGDIKGLSIESTDYQVAASSRSITQTTLERVTGLVAMLAGSEGTTTTTATYSSATEHYTATSTAPTIEVACDAAAEFEVEVFFDNLFGTFYTRQGALLAANAALTGNARDSQGRPRSNQRVILTLGGRQYLARTTPNGDFRFPFSSIPSGSGTLTVGAERYPVSFAGTPKSVTLRTGVGSGRATP